MAVEGSHDLKKEKLKHLDEGSGYVHHHDTAVRVLRVSHGESLGGYGKQDLCDRTFFWRGRSYHFGYKLRFLVALLCPR